MQDKTDKTKTRNILKRQKVKAGNNNNNKQ